MKADQVKMKPADSCSLPCRSALCSVPEVCCMHSRSPDSSQLCPFDLLHGVYMKPLHAATSQGHLFDPWACVFFVSTFRNTMNRIREDLAITILIFACSKCCDLSAQLGQRTLLPTHRCPCCSTEYNHVSFPVNELRADFSSHLVRKKADIFPHLGIEGVSKLRLCSFHVTAMLVWFFRGELFAEQLKLSLPWGKAFLPLWEQTPPVPAPWHRRSKGF